MSVHAYTPPQGRPRSTPPLPNGAASHPVMDTEGAIAAYQAGMSTVELRRSIGDSAMKRLLDVLEERGIPLRRGRYRAKTVAPADPVVVRPISADQPPRPGRQEGESKQAYANRVQQWMVQTDPVFREKMREIRRAAAKKGVASRRRKLARLRATLDKYRAERAQPPVPVVVAAPPTLWQRIKAWFA
jgi:hypothetical protein